MRLNYRNASYEATAPILEVTEHEILGTYRGNHWRCRTLDEMPIPATGPQLKYRGATYASNPRGGVRPVQVARACAAQAAHLMAKQTAHDTDAQRLTAQHRANLERNLARRLRVARAEGNELLVQMLEAERQALAL